MKYFTASIVCIFLLASISAVDASTWYIKADGSGDAQTIQAGIDSSTHGDVVLLANGTYTGVGNRDIDYNSKEITVQSESGNPDLCIIDCEGLGRGFIFESREDSLSVLDGVTITNGTGVYGGGIDCHFTFPTIRNCKFINNSATNGGGFSCRVQSKPSITDCIFITNSAVDGGGAFSDNSTPSFTNCTFIADSASSDGGGMQLRYSTATITSCTFTDNSAVDNGGGLHVYDDSDAVITDCDFSGNSAFSGGGMAVTQWGANPTISSCTFFDNSSAHGGGMYCFWSQPTITGCAFSGNSAVLNGGGMHCTATSTYIFPTMTSCTFYGNSSDSLGGGIFVKTVDMFIEDTIISFSTAGEAVYCVGAGDATLSCCDVFGNAGGDWVACLLGQGGSGGNFSLDPKFCNAGSDDLALRENSPCLPPNNSCGVLVGAFGLDCLIIPTLSLWGVIILCLILLAGGIAAIHSSSRRHA
jgi:parallel beta-helix repeat protein